jgi:hypothetical protein
MFAWKCPVCRGSGDQKCHTCYGTGRVTASAYNVDFGNYRYRNIPCPKCNGRGKRICPNCDGTGEVLRDDPPPPPPLDTAEFNRQKRERYLKHPNSGPPQKRDEMHGRVLPTIGSPPSGLTSRGWDDAERGWFEEIRRGSRMKGDDPE